MARLIQEILAEAEARPNPAGGNGLLLRSDVIEAVQGKHEPERSEAFEDLIENATFLTPQMKNKIKTDYHSFAHIE